MLGNSAAASRAIDGSASMLAAFGAADLSVIFERRGWMVILVLFLVDFYGSVAKLVGLLANTALIRDGKSLLPIGVVTCDGTFERGEIVGCFDPEGREIARGLVNYSASETLRILRKPSTQIAAILGYVDEPELIHRNNLVLL